MDPLDEPILPFHSLAGIRLGEREEAVVARLGEPLRRRVGEGGLIALYYPSFRIWLDHGTTAMLIAEEGYRGGTPECSVPLLSRRQRRRKSGVMGAGSPWPQAAAATGATSPSFSARRSAGVCQARA